METPLLRYAHAGETKVMKTTIKILLAAVLTAFTGRLANRLEAAPKKSSRVYGLNGFSFDSGSGISNRFITPNGDTFNDSVIFTFDNPRDSSVTGSIFDLRGHLVANLAVGPTIIASTQATLMWDGKMGGQAVSGGIYIYVIQSEETVVSGTVVVIR